jgi:alpha-amylase/alpha-mannosidase (GH57 family)
MQGKKNLIVDDLTEKEYVPFLVNKSLSYQKDCILFANEMNRRHFLDNKLQFDFLINTIRSKKRSFVKWVKPEVNDDVNMIKKYFGYNDDKARQALRVLTPEDLAIVRDRMDVGGIK